MHDLYGGIRERLPHLTEKHFRLSNGVKKYLQIVHGHLQLDNWEPELHDRANIVVTFPTDGARQGWSMYTGIQHYTTL